ncbi:adipose-secreted signaling protein-like [Babylonia areolata]|uniref:adipose-secreted signaling protein-like n=1 Tax=Babylonia areolata TaxID=304850 RepID=UPI003FD59514
MEATGNLKSASEDASTLSSSHVHFKAEDVSTHESEIVVESGDEEDVMKVHLGFLKVKHTYEITFTLPHKRGKDIIFDPLENLLVKVKEVTPTEDGHKLVVEFNAEREKVMKEKITMRTPANSDDTVFIVFIARVLGKHKGTPSLRNGIHCVHVEAEEDEGSDWQGF